MRCFICADGISTWFETFPDLDPKVRKLFMNAEDIKMWRLYLHDEYPYWVRGRCALLGDAAHPMMPDQSQGACMAFEDVSEQKPF
jgi:salicylate hydroxylase